MKAAIVVVGASLGGAAVFKKLLPALPETYRTPVVIVQHRVAHAESKLRDALQRLTSLPVLEPEDKSPIDPGAIYLAPPDYHLMVDRECFHLSTEAPVRFARPSIDVLFESAADYFAEAVLALVLSGASDDGAYGATCVRSRGGRVLVQDPRTARSPVMPNAVIEATAHAEVMTVAELQDALLALA